MRNISRYGIAIALIICALFATDYTVQYCQVSRLNVRAEPNTNSEILGTLSRNDPITPIGETENWYRIEHQNREAWVYKAYFSGGKAETATYWYNSKSGVLHNKNCRWYGNTKKGCFTDEAIGRDCKNCGGAYRSAPVTGYEYWINTNSGVRHNRGCRWYGNTKRGYFTNERLGRGCGLCGG